MGTTADKLARLVQTKNDIKDAITTQGGDVDGKPFKDYADEILELKTGGSGPWKFIKPDEWVGGKYTGNDDYVILHPGITDLPSNDGSGNVFNNAKGVILDSSVQDPNVTDMDSMFAYSQAIELDLSSFDTSSVTDMDSMFYRSQAIELDLSSFDTSSVTNMSSMFHRSQVIELDLSSFDTSSVTDMEYMFAYSQAIELDLSSFDTSSVTDMEYMFAYSKVKTIYARTEADKQRFESSSGFPSGVTVIVGTP